MVSDETADGILRYLHQQNLVETEYDNKRREQKLRITDKGDDVCKVLTWFKGLSVDCPQCGIESKDVTSYLTKDVRKTSVLCHCEDCDIVWGRTNV